MDWNRNELLPLSKFKQMRSSFPIEPKKEGGPWNVYKYEDVKAVFTNYQLFSSQGTSSAEEPIEASILKQDPPKHRQLRKLVSQAFTPRAIESLAPKIKAIAHELCDIAEARGTMDALDDLASPLPIIIIAELLGVPPSDRHQFRQWSDALVGNDSEQYVQCQREMSEYFSLIAEERRLAPQNDLISNLVHARVDDEQLSDLEMIGFCILLLVAGNETTTNLITSALLCFDSDRNAREELLADHSLLPQAIEEVLRYCSPVQMMSRWVRQDTVLRGQTLKAGQWVNLWIGSANHDEEIFGQSEQFDIHRHPNPHLAFGSGIHFCLGANLARMEADIALQTFLVRFPNYRRDRSYELERLDSHLMFGVKHLPLVLR